MNTSPALFGITRSNRDFSQAYYWGKNQFNSSFPAALACYMGHRGLPLVYLRADAAMQTQVTEIALSEVFGTTLPPHEIYFAFEERYAPFATSVHDALPPIDLVICARHRDAPIRPLEIKLTTLPDNTTESLTEDRYGAEIVMRSATTRYMALSMSRAAAAHSSAIRKLFDAAMSLPAAKGRRRLRDWDAESEALAYAPSLVAALCQFVDLYGASQSPLVLQPIWKTVGKSPQLASNCLDVFVWSDFALTHLFLPSALQSAASGQMTRQLRTALRLARFLYEAASNPNDRVHQAPIFDGMTYDLQNDKEFAISGTKTQPIMACDRLATPAVRRDEIRHIILGGGQKYLSPERRFDAILYFSSDLFS